jgi:hypothetical protein
VQDVTFSGLLTCRGVHTLVTTRPASFNSSTSWSSSGKSGRLTCPNLKRVSSGLDVHVISASPLLATAICDTQPMILWALGWKVSSRSPPGSIDSSGPSSDGQMQLW